MSDTAELRISASPGKRGSRTAAILRPIRAAKHLLLIVVAPMSRYYHGELFLRLTEGDSVERSLAEFARTPAGAALLQERPDVRALLQDRALLGSCPEGSLGRSYSDHLSDAQLDDGAYFDLAEIAGAERSDPVISWYRTRVGVMHDLRHLITGYDANRLGEACLLIFRFAQTGHVGQLVLGGLALVSALLEPRPRIFAAVIEAYRRGRRARSTDLIPWEKTLDEPLAVHRAWLGLSPPEQYAPSVAPEAYLRADARPVVSLAGASARLPPRGAETEPSL